MSPARIRTRPTKTGRSYQVIYRRGGRAFPLETAGTFSAKREAEIRRDLVGGWLAAGLDPKVELAKLTQDAPARPRLDRLFDQLIASRHDVGPSRLSHYRHGKAHAADHFGADRDPHTISIAEVREYVGVLVGKGMSPSTVESYFRPLALALDLAELERNPARDRTVKLPASVRAEPVVMTLTQFRAMVSKLPARWVLFFRILEATGMRVGELAALTWGDVDERDSRLRISRTRTKTRAGQRWAYLPLELMNMLASSLPTEDRTPARSVFPGCRPNGAWKAMERACRTAGIPAFSPHDLRHRRASLWHAQGVPGREVQERVGHARLSVTQDVYTHVVVDPTDDEWFAAAVERRPGGGSVMTND